MWLYHSRGIHPDGNDAYSKQGREVLIQRCPQALRGALLLQYEALDALAPIVLKAHQQLCDEVNAHAVGRMLQTCPGIGAVYAAQLMATMINPHRFRTKRQLWAYSGLGIVTRSSSDWVHQQGHWVKANVAQCRGLNRRSNRTLKAVFKGAAMVVSTRVNAEHPLRRYYQRRLESGTKPNLAQLTLARKLAAIVLHMWKHNQEFNPELI